MAFIDDLSRRLSQTSENAVQKTRQIAEIGRLENIIRQELQKINDGYYQVGKMYVGLHPDDYAQDFAFLIDGIHESEQKVQSMRQQVRELKGITVCEQCGAEVPVTTIFCSTCGAQMPKTVHNADVENKVKCEQCGNYVQKNMRFCTACGSPMPPAAQPQQTVQTAPQPQPTQQRAPGFKVTLPGDSGPAPRSCPNCGALMEDREILFCTECGTRL